MPAVHRTRHDLSRPQRELEDDDHQQSYADHSVDLEKGPVDPAQVLRLHEPVLVGQQAGDAGDPGKVNDTELRGGGPVEGDEKAHHDDMTAERHTEGGPYAEARRHAMKPSFAVEFHVLAGVKNIEACDPKHDSQPEYDRSEQ